MAIIIDCDSDYAGFGIDWNYTVKGFRLGWIGLHWMSKENFRAMVEPLTLIQGVKDE